jgi:thioredoxin 1
MSEQLSASEFKARVFDWEKNKDWSFSGPLPVIVDFYAEWCMPCKMLSPVLEELSTKYSGKMDVFKVDIDKEPELASVFGVQSVPSLLFIPKEGEPSMALGALPKAALEKAINEVLGVASAISVAS